LKSGLILLAVVMSCASERVTPREIAAERDQIAAIRSSEEEIKKLTKERKELIETVRKLNGEIDRLKGELSECRAERVAMKAAVVTGRKPRLIVFTAMDWCPACVQYDVQITKLGDMEYTLNGVKHRWSESIGSDESKAIQVVDCSDEDSDNAKWAMRVGIGTYPTTVRVDDEGVMQERHTGQVEALNLSRWLAGKWKPPIRLDSIINAKPP